MAAHALVLSVALLSLLLSPLPAHGSVASAGQPHSSRIVSMPARRRVLETETCDDCRAQLGDLRKWYRGIKAGEAGANSATSAAEAQGEESPMQRQNRGGGGGGQAQRSLVATAGESVEALKEMLQQKQAELKALQHEYKGLQVRLARVSSNKEALDLKLSEMGTNVEQKFLTPQAVEFAANALQKCGLQSGVVANKKTSLWKGYACSATDEELQAYFDYEPMKLCPDDWFLVQHLIFVRNCFALPKRRCLGRTPASFVEPLPFPRSLFQQKALIDSDVRWNLHWCKSFECLNARSVGDCRNCFNMSLESRRWRRNFLGSLTIREVLEMKKGSLRIGLDAGGGTGSFAAHMARHNVTVVTTAMNIESVVGRKKGLPYMETIALRGLVPLWIPHKGRLPFFDNTLDIVHTVNSIRYLPLPEFEDLLFEWDRVLRVGGIMWFEMFHASVDEMPAYVAVIDLLQYKRLYWKVTAKERRDKKQSQLYLNCLLEKPIRKDP